MPDLPSCPYRPHGGVSPVRSPSSDGRSANALPTSGSASVVRLSKSVRATHFSAQMSCGSVMRSVAREERRSWGWAVVGASAMDRAGFRIAEWGSRSLLASMGRAEG